MRGAWTGLYLKIGNPSIFAVQHQTRSIRKRVAEARADGEASSRRSLVRVSLCGHAKLALRSVTSPQGNEASTTGAVMPPQLSAQGGGLVCIELARAQ